MHGALERLERRAGRDVLGQHLGDHHVDALLRQVPRLDLALLVVAQRREDGAPALGAEAVAAQAARRLGTLWSTGKVQIWQGACAGSYEQMLTRDR